ncbi:hypothetical protein Pcinc_017085 [Petrolisthes cinctipes]|uniref:Uncharacterized protein n=1 Tax=Petrolisthes cinctipes TaxID=88211 RepID=A0AAE1FPZ3_PETCI|nr:hypothetical protein Pcinc_017085 [Petrolisthes cinctipes]
MNVAVGRVELRIGGGAAGVVLLRKVVVRQQLESVNTRLTWRINDCASWLLDPPHDYTPTPGSQTRSSPTCPSPRSPPAPPFMHAIISPRHPFFISIIFVSYYDTSH